MLSDVFIISFGLFPDTVMLAPEFNPNARIFAPATFAEKKVSELCPVKPPVKELARTLTEDWQDKSLDELMSQASPDEGTYKFPIPRTGSTSTSMFNNTVLYIVQAHCHVVRI